MILTLQETYKTTTNVVYEYFKTQGSIFMRNTNVYAGCFKESQKGNRTILQLTYPVLSKVDFDAVIFADATMLEIETLISFSEKGWAKLIVILINPIIVGETICIF